MRKAIIAVAVVLVVLLVGTLMTFGEISDGAFSLQVEVIVDGDPPRWVSCQAHHEERQAEWASKQPMLYDDFERIVMVTPFEGKPFNVPVECSYLYHRYAFGLQTNWVQRRYLVVMADWPDGRHLAKVVPIPDGQTTQTLRVELP